MSAIGMLGQSLGTLSIEELKSKHFHIPTYQRGYRWTDVQVQQLLEDVAEFQPNGEAFYCLQPIVVRDKKAGRWEVIDGQQRLTTIWLIQRLLNYNLVPYSLDFDNDSRQTISRKTLEDAVSQVENAGEPAIDLQKAPLEASYVYGAAAAIKKWREGKTAEYLDDFCAKLLGHTRVIWYQTPSSDGNAQTIFTRLNAGKIPLTNAELIKALLLKRPTTNGAETAYAPWQFELAAAWDSMEAALGQPNFWGWLGQRDDPERPPRLEWLLRLVEDQRERIDDAQPLALFQAVEKRLKGKLPADNWHYWQAVEKVFQRLRGWYDDPDLYHRVGYLVAVGDRWQLKDSQLKELLTLAESETKSAFLVQLARRIADRAGLTADNATKQWDQLQYKSHNGLLNNILLLHNVVTTWQARNMGGRFPFEKYLREKKWSLEHIHPQNPQMESESPSTYQVWLDDWQKEFEQWPDSLQQEKKADLQLRVAEAQQSLKAEIVDEELAGTMLALRTTYIARFSDLAAAPPSGGTIDPLHALENLALLGGGDNSALSNAVFPEKRAKLLQLHHASSGFVPPATLEVFLKTHTPHPDDLRRWNKADRQHYRAAIERSILLFINSSTQS
ncbi:DUF262 domain-containing protein [Hymenobacter sp. UYCo722]|uniref:DUF262 domain-containing protein n=1 Tax=Hymenobacter sp. UYCo722 TaxID=3156335 RepID=UPI003391399B